MLEFAHSSPLSSRSSSFCAHTTYFSPYFLGMLALTHFLQTALPVWKIECCGHQALCHIDLHVWCMFVWPAKVLNGLLNQSLVHFPLNIIDWFLPRQAIPGGWRGCICSLVLMNCDLLIMLLHQGAKSGPAATSAVSLLSPRKEKQQGNTTKKQQEKHQEEFCLLGFLNWTVCN